MQQTQGRDFPSASYTAVQFSFGTQMNQSCKGPVQLSVKTQSRCWSRCVGYFAQEPYHMKATNSLSHITVNNMPSWDLITEIHGACLLCKSTPSLISFLPRTEPQFPLSSHVRIRLTELTQSLSTRLLPPPMPNAVNQVLPGSGSWLDRPLNAIRSAGIALV